MAGGTSTGQRDLEFRGCLSHGVVLAMKSLITRFVVFCGLVVLSSAIYAVPYLTIQPRPGEVAVLEPRNAVPVEASIE